MAERDRRHRARSDRLTRYKDDPIGFVELGLLGFLWSKQKQIFQSVLENRHTAVKSCHDVGKSFGAASIAAWWISAFPPGEAFVVTLAPTGHQVKGILWRELARIHNAGKLPGYLNQTEWKIPCGANDELVGFGRSPKDTDPTAIQGIHQKRVLVIFDEACGIAKQLWDAADSMVANEFSRFLAIGNPDDPTSEFATVCKPGSGWNVIGISAFESPNLTGEEVPDWLRPLLVSPIWVAERKKKWGEDSPLYRSKVLGEFPEQSVDGLIPLHAIAAACVRELEPTDPNELGVDVARFGRNYTTIYHRRGRVAKRMNKVNGNDTMQVCGLVIAAIRATGARKVKIDDTGVGGGVTDRLNEIKRDKLDEELFALMRDVDVVPVNVGERPTIEPVKDKDKDEKHLETERFYNLRAQLNWAIRVRCIDGDIAIVDADDDLKAQMSDIKYYMTSRGQIKIESKEDMESRGVESPDDWDGLVLAFADIGMTGASTWAAFGRNLK